VGRERARRAGLSFLLATLVAVGAPAATAADKLPPGTLRGNVDRLHQYPTLSLATPAQRAAARRLLADVRAATRDWRDVRAAAADGFGFDRATSRRGDRRPDYLHAEHRPYSNDRIHLDPWKPESLVYASVPGRPLVLVGVQFSVRRGERGPTPGGPITRWHTHRVCARGAARGVAPRRDGSCPPGTKPRQGSEMLHVWLTRDLRSAYAIHAPEPELCAARLLPLAHCRHRH